MNCGVYLRKLQAGRKNVIGFQNGQDASQVTLKNQAKAQSVNVAGTVPTSFSRIDGPVSITEPSQQNSSSPSCAGGYQGFVNGFKNMNTSVGRIVGPAQHCAVCADAPSSEPYKVVLPCRPFINPIAYNPDATTIDPLTTTPGTKPEKISCTTSRNMGIVNTDKSELVADQVRQMRIRTQYNLPSRLTSLRGPLVNRNI